MLLLELAALLSFISLDSFSLLSRQHLFVFNPQLSTLKLHVIHRVDNMSRLFGVGEVCKGKTSEHAIVEVIIERIREWQLHLRHEGDQLLFLDSERYIFDNNSCRDELFAFESTRSRRRATWWFLHHLRVELTVHLVIVHVLGLLLHLRIHPDL